MKRLLLPYAFRGVQLDFLQLYQPGRIVDRSKATSYLGEGIHKQFSQIFSDVLQAISENDREYLSSIMEKRLYNRTIKGMEQIEDQKLKIQYLESPTTDHEEVDLKQEMLDSEKNSNSKQNAQEMFRVALESNSMYKENDMRVMLEAHGVFGAKINREQNMGKKCMELRGRLSSRTYFLNLQSIQSLYYDQILSLNVYFSTTRRLFVSDQDGDLIHGEDTCNKEVQHVWKFETYTPKYDWVLTDMDNYLDGNQYYKQTPSIEEEKEEVKKKE